MRNKAGLVVLVVVRPTNNNLFITAQLGAKLICWLSCGFKFHGPRRSLPLAAEATGQHVSNRLVAMGVKSVQIRICGVFSSRVKAGLKGFFSSDKLQVSSVELISFLSHNGLRAAKVRRV